MELPDDVVRELAGALGIPERDARVMAEALRSGAPGAGAVRDWATGQGWTYNEAAAGLDHARRLLLAKGLLSDPLLEEAVRAGPPATFTRHGGRVAAVGVHDPGGPGERLFVRFSRSPYTFAYDGRAPGYARVKRALIEGGEFAVWTPPTRPTRPAANAASGSCGRGRRSSWATPRPRRTTGGRVKRRSGGAHRPWARSLR